VSDTRIAVPFTLLWNACKTNRGGGGGGYQYFFRAKSDDDNDEEEEGNVVVGCDCPGCSNEFAEQKPPRVF